MDSSRPGQKRRQVAFGLPHWLIGMVDDWGSLRQFSIIFHLMISYVHVFPYSEEVTMKARQLPCQTFSVIETAENRDVHHRLK